ncbi:MAG TPA: ferritin family protein [Bacteroidales bacterium]|nr:ferritin family protein [Bacteroidales bacterium]
MKPTEDRVQDILKQAIIMESRAKALYSKVADQTSSEEVKRIFGIMAKEEQMHIDFLKKQYSNYQNKQQFAILDKGAATASPQVADLILTESVKNEISGAGFEAAAISAAIDMENKSIEAYTARANEASDPNEKAFYEWLVNWEKDHHKLLISLNRELTEKIWYDNQFWPF